MSASVFRAALVLLLSIQSAALVSAAEVTIALGTAQVPLHAEKKP